MSRCATNGCRKFRDAIARQAADQLGLTATQVRAASRYYAELAGEVDAEITRNEEAADREFAVWDAERRLPSG